MTLTSEQVFETYESRLLRKRRAEGTLRSYRSSWAHFLAHTSDPVTPQMVQDWVWDSAWAPSTTRTAYSWIKAAYRHCEEKDIIERSPCRSWIELEDPEDPDPTYFTAIQRARFEDGCATVDDLALIRLFLYTGMRSIEVRRLTWDKIEDGVMHVHGKGNKWRYIPVHPELQGVLRELRMRSPHVVGTERGALSESGLRERVLRITGESHKHGFRSTFASDLLMHDVAESTIDRLLGHGPKSMFAKHYSAMVMGSLRSAVLKLYT